MAALFARPHPRGFGSHRSGRLYARVEPSAIPIALRLRGRLRADRQRRHGLRSAGDGGAGPCARRLRRSAPPRRPGDARARPARGSPAATGGRGPARADEGVLGRRLRRRKAVRPTHARLRRRRPRRHAPTDQNARHDGDLDLVHGAAMRMRVQAPRQRDGQRQARAFGEVAAASPMASDRPWSSWTRTVATGHIARTRAVRRTAAAAALARAVAASCSPGFSGPRPNGTRRAAGPWFTTASAGSSGRSSCPIRWRRSTISRS